MIKRISAIYNRMSYRNKLLCFQVCFISAVIVVVGCSMIFFLSDTLMGREKEHLDRLLQIVNEKVSGQIEVFDSAGFDLLINSSLKNSLNQTDSIEYGRAFHTIKELLSIKTLATVGLKNIMIIDRQDHIYSSNFAVLLPGEFRLEDTGVFQAADRQKGTLVWLTENDIYENYSMGIGMYENTSDIHAAAVIQDYVSNETLGVMILSLDNDYFENMAFSDNLMEGTDFYLISPDKKQNYKIFGTKTELGKGVLEKLSFTERDAGVYTEKERIISYRYNKKMGWYLVSITETRFLRESIYQIAWTLVFILGIGIVVFLLASDCFFKAMTKGIYSLMDGMAKVEQGKFDVIVESDKSDEIGKLTNTFNHMVKQIKELVISKYQQELLARETEFQALQAQINPHFLYNTLDMLNWQLVIRGEDDLSNSVISIGNLLRYSISGEPVNVSLKKELDNVRDYLSVQFSISGKEVAYTIDAADEDHILLPRLSLQPLAENAVTHGFEGRDKNNYLSVTGYYEESNKYKKYIIKFRDNGIGISEEKVKKLNEAARQESFSHIGIANVRKRISYLYGENMEMVIESRYGYGTTVRIELLMESGTNESGNC